MLVFMKLVSSVRGVLASKSRFCMECLEGTLELLQFFIILPS